jgi:hypothetical protein
MDFVVVAFLLKTPMQIRRVISAIFSKCVIGGVSFLGFIVSFAESMLWKNLRLPVLS